MASAKVIKAGNSQAVRLPKKFRFKSREVEIFRRGNEIILREKSAPMARAFEILADLPDDMFPEGRVNTRPQQRPTMSANSREYRD